VRPDFAAWELQAPIRTERLCLRPLGDADVDALVAYRSIPEVCRWVPFEPMDADTVRGRLRTVAWSQFTLAADDDTIILGIEATATGELVGDVMLRLASVEDRTAEIGYVVHPRHAGHGYATEASNGLLRVAFDELGLHRVIARVDAENTDSVRVVARLGMRQEAHFVEGSWFKGRWSDELHFGLLAAEWRARGTSAR
jgi:RimJ/RimL family protein N-acetyltransferase